MSTTIKRGTGRRLGLRPPPPRLLIQFPPLSDEQMAEFKARFAEAARELRQGLMPLSFGFSDHQLSRREHRRRLGLRWWQRRPR